MKSFWIATPGLAWLIFWSGFSWSAEPTTISEPAESVAPLIVYGDRSLPPFEFIEDGVPKGMTVDLWQEIGRALQRPVEVRLGEWSQAQQAVLSGEGDVLPPLVRTPERARDFNFTQTVFPVTFSLFMREAEHARIARSTPENLRIGVTSGGFPRSYLGANHPGAKLTTVTDTADGIRRVLRGDIDALAANTTVARHFVREFHITGIAEAAQPFASLESAIAVHKRNPELRQQIDRALDQLRQDGTFDRIVAPWSRLPSVVLSERQVWLSGLGLGSIVLVFLFLAALSERRRITSLQHELARRQVVERELEQAKMTAETARAIAEAANRAKSEFLANMSHEIRTPMNAIIGLTRMMQREPDASVDTERLRKVDAAAQHLLALVSDVLDLSKIDSGKLVLDRSEFSLGALLSSVQSNIADQANAKGLKLIIDAQDESLCFVGDPTRLRQALLNFASNAVKFTHEGTIWLRGRIVDGDDGNVVLRLEVEDTGIGVPAEFEGRLFEAFEQASISMTRQYGGTGLGLSITRRLATVMGGSVGHERRAGGGSRFWFTAQVQPAQQPRAPGARAPATCAAQRLRDEFAGSTVLIAEDNEVNLEVASHLVSSVGLVVLRAMEGEQAVRTVAEQHVDLVLMDVQMPRMDGLMATLEIRKHWGPESLPIIALTANAFDDDRRMCLEAGMNGFLSKPVDPDLLYEKLLKWLSATHSQVAA